MKPSGLVLGTTQKVNSSLTVANTATEVYAKKAYDELTSCAFPSFRIFSFAFFFASAARLIPR